MRAEAMTSQVTMAVMPELVPFVVVAVLLTLTPGSDTMVVLSHATRYDRAEAQRAVWGVIGGLAVWAGAAILGVSALLAASETAYDGLRVVGAAYLVWLGLQALWAARRDEAEADVAPLDRRAHGFRAGFTSNLLNPKVGVFYLSFLPQFIPDGGNTFLWGVALAAVHILTGLVWLTVVARLAGAAKERFGPRFRRVTSAVGGVALLGFGARLALTDH
jgi:threonine/homoserine/homoserine lactone efflux protein